MKIEIKKILEEIPNAIHLGREFFLHRIMSRLFRGPYIISKIELVDTIRYDIVNKFNRVERFKTIFREDSMDAYNPTTSRHLYLLDQEVLLYMEDTLSEIYIYAAYNNPNARGMKTVWNMLAPFVKSEMSDRGKISLMVKDSYFGLSTREFKLPDVEVDLAMQYNDNLIDFHDEVISVLNGKKKNGIIFLYGDPGTGKTTYIRYLISKLERKVIFVPSDMVHHLASPDIMNFMLRNKHSVMVIEDAESVLEDRSNTRNSVVSNLLNLSDGILSDALHIQFVCTFNTNINQIDEAFFRGGRMLAIHEFKELETVKANKLAESLGMDKTFEKPTKLSDIYNSLGEMNRDKRNKGIGFVKK